MATVFPPQGALLQLKLKKIIVILILNFVQAGDYPVVGGGVDPDYGQYVSSPAAHYNHMGHLTMAPSQKYPHVSLIVITDCVTR